MGVDQRGFVPYSNRVTMTPGMTVDIAPANPERVVLALSFISAGSGQVLIRCEGVGSDPWGFPMTENDVFRFTWNDYGPLVTGRWTAQSVSTSTPICVYQCIYRG